MPLMHSFPHRALRYAFQLPSRLYSRFITEPIVKRWIRTSDMTVFVHDPQRGLLRPVLEGERLKWTLNSNLAVDATYWLDVIEPLLTKEDIVFDVGANIGTIANWFSKRTKHVYGFEPHPDNIRLTQEQISLRRRTNITLSSLALGSEPGTLPLHVKRFHGHHSFGNTAASPTVDIIEVEVGTVDQFCSTNGIERIDLLKIDVEGFEEDVLRGASSMLSNQSIGLVLFELRRSILTSVGKNAQDIFTPLVQHGYTVFTLEGKTLTAEELEQPTDADYLAAVNPEAYITRLGTSSAPVL